MLGDLKRLGKETLVYGLSTVAGRLLNFLLLPFYTHVLTPGELGIVAVVFTYLGFLNAIYQYGMDQAYLRYASSLEIGDKRDNFSTPMWAVAASSLVFSGIIVLSRRSVAAAAHLPPALTDIPVYCAAVLALDALSAVPFAELRLRHRAWYYVAVKLAGIATNVALNVVLLWKFHMGLRGVFLASAVASAAGWLLLAPVLAAGWRPVFHKTLFDAMLRFGLPYIPALLASTAVQVVDRPILQWMTDDSTVGIYQANYRLGIFMMLFVSMFDAAWRPFFLERGDGLGARETLGRVLTYFSLAGIFLCLILSIFLYDLVRLPILGHGRTLIPAIYWPGLGVAPIVLVGYLFNGVYINFMAQVTLAKRTDLLIWATALGALVNVGANLALIPLWGILGAAAATLLAYAAMALCLFLLGQPIHPIPYEYGRLARLTAAGSICGAVAGWIFWMRPSFPNYWTWTAARGLAAVGFPVLAWAFGFLRPEEKKYLAGIISGRPAAG